MKHLRFQKHPIYFKDKPELPGGIRIDIILIGGLNGIVNLKLDEIRVFHLCFLANSID